MNTTPETSKMTSSKEVSKVVLKNNDSKGKTLKDERFKSFEDSRTHAGKTTRAVVSGRTSLTWMKNLKKKRPT